MIDRRKLLNFKPDFNELKKNFLILWYFIYEIASCFSSWIDGVVNQIWIFEISPVIFFSR